ncbi:GNAT family N-acetyltransferase [Legionella dresdenensis]|uniref:GNAT family N-acetyltransferase n=1 Tax=Legionella dresdenensis TaxID=450200 RepID=A0ABV8CGI2_9GAMM
MNRTIIEVDYHPDNANVDFLRQKIIDFNKRYLHEKASQFNVLARDDKNHCIIGGASVWQHSDALYIDILWLEEGYRRQKLGTEIINTIAEQANKNNIKKLYVDTYDFQAVDFYVKQGFLIIAEVKNYLLEHDLVYLKKELV